MWRKIDWHEMVVTFVNIVCATEVWLCGNERDRRSDFIARVLLKFINMPTICSVCL